MFGKLIIKSDIKVLTGMHIGGSSVFSSIGAVDSPVIVDTYSQHPIIPGSSLKGKMRTLLSRSLNNGKRCNFNEDPEIIKHMFGSSEPVINSRLQFADCFVTEESLEKFRNTGLTEVKYENTINRLSAVANPRQMERVLPDVTFTSRITYTIEEENEIEKDLLSLAKGMKLLQMDYLGGGGSRGNGRISFTNITVSDPDGVLTPEQTEKYSQLFKEAEGYDLLSL